MSLPGNAHMIGQRTPFVVALFALAALSPRASHAQNATQSDDPVVTALSSRMADFFEGVSALKAKDAFAKLLEGSQLARRDRQEQLAGLIKKTGELETNYGPYHSYERITARRIGADLVVLKYLYKCENFPVVWHVIFYRDQRESRTAESSAAFEKWLVISIRSDTELEALAK